MKIISKIKAKSKSKKKIKNKGYSLKGWTWTWGIHSDSKAPVCWAKRGTLTLDPDGNWFDSSNVGRVVNIDPRSCDSRLVVVVDYGVGRNRQHPVHLKNAKDIKSFLKTNPELRLLLMDLPPWDILKEIEKML